MLYLFIFWELSEPSRARKRTNTEVRLALPSAKPSLPRGLLWGEPPTVPKKSPMFFRKISVSKFLVYLGKTDARHKQLRYEAGRVVGPPTPSGYGTPLTTTLLAEVYQSRIREHGKRVKKTRARTHKASMGHTVDSEKTNFLYL